MPQVWTDDELGGTIWSEDEQGGRHVSAYIETLLDDANASAAQTTLGISAYAQTLLDDANAAAARTTLDVPGLTDLSASSGSSLISTIQSGTGAVSETVQSKARRDQLDVFDFMTAAQKTDVEAGTGALDVTTAWQAAVTEAESVGQRTVHVHGLRHKLTGTITSSKGVTFKGDGPLYGTSVAYYPSANNLPLFLFNGSYGFRVGGGVEDLRLMKANAATGCDAIKCLAVDDNHRPGELIFRNVFVTMDDSTVFNWARAWNIDGTACTTLGSKGVRSVLFEKCRATSCSTSNEYVLLNQAVHVVANMLQIDTVSGTGTCGMTISGDSDNLILNELICDGNLIIGGSSQMFVTIGGRLTTLDVNNTLVEGSANIAVQTGITNAAKNLRITSNKASAFLGVCTTATANNKTGDNTAYNVIYDSETYDKNDEFDYAGGTFTAKIAGRYKVSGKIELRNLGAAHTRSDCRIYHKNSGGTILADYNAPLNPFACGTNAGANFAHFVSAEVEMAEGDLLQMSATVSGSTKTVGVGGNAIANGDFSWFSAHLLA